MDYTLTFGFLAAFLVGASKGGLKGLGVFTVALTALVYGAKNSVGILVPLFIVGDVLAVIYFKKHVKVKYLFQFLPAMIIGVLVATYVGNDWEEATFKKWMSIIILGSTVYMFWSEYREKKLSIEDKKMSSTIGFAAGFTTMIGNLAGPFANLYFLATRLPKNEIIGTAAWVFFIINIFKIPFHVFSWETINVDTLTVDAYLAPFVVLGFWAGTRLVSMFSEQNYRRFLLIVTAIGAVLILLK
ncbi:MAG: putative membrane protein YfcA [Saprospiraceae bacterium]|jgi:uncharacterized membrane protein YfcA